MMMIQSDSEDSSLDKKAQEVVNLFLMAQEEEITCETKLEFTFAELLEAFYELVDKYKILDLKNKNHRTSNQLLIREKEKLLEEKKSIFKKKKQEQKKKVEKYKPIIENFTYSSKKLQMLFNN